MRICVNIATLLLLLVTAVTMVSAQKITCSCEYAKGKDKCNAKTVSSDGCTAVCGPHGACGSYTRRNVYDDRFTVSFVKKTGEQIASELSALTRQRIEFEPSRGNKGVRYDVDMKNDDIFNVLNFLNKRGNVWLNGTDFSKIRELQNKKTSPKKEVP
jgi:hypothetical protein